MRHRSEENRTISTRTSAKPDMSFNSKNIISIKPCHMTQPLKLAILRPLPSPLKLVASGRDSAYIEIRQDGIYLIDIDKLVRSGKFDLRFNITLYRGKLILSDEDRVYYLDGVNTCLVGSQVFQQQAIRSGSQLIQVDKDFQIKTSSDDECRMATTIDSYRTAVEVRVNRFVFSEHEIYSDRQRTVERLAFAITDVLDVHYLANPHKLTAHDRYILSGHLTIPQVIHGGQYLLEYRSIQNDVTHSIVLDEKRYVADQQLHVPIAALKLPDDTYTVRITVTCVEDATVMLAQSAWHALIINTQSPPITAGDIVIETDDVTLCVDKLGCSGQGVKQAYINDANPSLSGYSDYSNHFILIEFVAAISKAQPIDSYLVPTDDKGHWRFELASVGITLAQGDVLRIRLIDYLGNLCSVHTEIEYHLIDFPLTRLAQLPAPTLIDKVYTDTGVILLLCAAPRSLGKQLLNLDMHTLASRYYTFTLTDSLLRPCWKEKVYPTFDLEHFKQHNDELAFQAVLCEIPYADMKGNDFHLAVAAGFDVFSELFVQSRDYTLALLSAIAPSDVTVESCIHMNNHKPTVCLQGDGLPAQVEFQLEMVSMKSRHYRHAVGFSDSDGQWHIKEISLESGEYELMLTIVDEDGCWLPTQLLNQSIDVPFPRLNVSLNGLIYSGTMRAPIVGYIPGMTLLGCLLHQESSQATALTMSDFYRVRDKAYLTLDTETLPDGTYQLTLELYDYQGRCVSHSDGIELSIDNAPLLTASIERIGMDHETQTMVIAGADATRTGHVEVSVALEAYGQVNSRTIDARVDETGRWQAHFAPSEADLNQSLHMLTVRQWDANRQQMTTNSYRLSLPVISTVNQRPIITHHPLASIAMVAGYAADPKMPLALQVFNQTTQMCVMAMPITAISEEGSFNVTLSDEIARNGVYVLQVIQDNCLLGRRLSSPIEITLCEPKPFNLTAIKHFYTPAFDLFAQLNTTQQIGLLCSYGRINAILPKPYFQQALTTPVFVLEDLNLADPRFAEPPVTGTRNHCQDLPRLQLQWLKITDNDELCLGGDSAVSHHQIEATMQFSDGPSIAVHGENFHNGCWEVILPLASCSGALLACEIAQKDEDYSLSTMSLDRDELLRIMALQPETDEASDIYSEINLDEERLADELLLDQLTLISHETLHQMIGMSDSFDTLGLTDDAMYLNEQIPSTMSNDMSGADGVISFRERY